MGIPFLLNIYKVLPLGKGWQVIIPEQPLFSWEITFGDILTIIGMLLSFGLFCYELYKSREEQSNNTRSMWFLDVVVKPKMEDIIGCYKLLIETADNKVHELHQMFERNDGAQDVRLKLARYQREIKNIIKNTFDPFQSIVGATEKDVSVQLNNKVDELVDIATKYLDEYETYYDGVSIKEKALENEQEIISILYNGFNNVK